MIAEFAVDPEVVAHWDAFRYFTDHAGVHRGRLIARYPDDWPRQVGERARSVSTFLDYQRIVDRLRLLQDRVLIQRPGRPTYDRRLPWPANAVVEHRRTRPFKAIVCEDAVPGYAETVAASQITADHPQFTAETSQVLRRDATTMATALAPLIALPSRSIVFVDPYFDPAEDRWAALICACLRRAQPLWTFLPKVRILTAVKGLKMGRAAQDAHVALHFGRVLDRVPSGIQVSVFRVLRRKGQERFHNRYVLNDWGGVKFGIGLDMPPSGVVETDDVGILSADEYATRWRQHAKGDPSAFGQALITQGVGRYVE